MKQILFSAMLLTLFVACDQQSQYSKQTNQNTQSKQNKPSMEANQQAAGAVEVVIYQAKEGISQEEALEKAQSVNSFVKAQKGFISRNMSATADGKWVDVIFWESLEDAEKATEQAMSAALPSEYFTIIDENTMQFVHAKTAFSITK